LASCQKRTPALCFWKPIYLLLQVYFSKEILSLHGVEELKGRRCGNLWGRSGLGRLLVSRKVSPGPTTIVGDGGDLDLEPIGIGCRSGAEFGLGALHSPPDPK